MHCCNNVGAWGAGFVLAISKKWDLPEIAYKKWFETKKIPDLLFDNVYTTGSFQLGQVQFVKVNDNIYIANIIGQKGLGGFAVRYNALTLGMKYCSKFAEKYNLDIAAPRLGSGLAGGEWFEIENIINTELINKNIKVRIYSL